MKAITKIVNYIAGVCWYLILLFLLYGSFGFITLLLIPAWTNVPMGERVYVNRVDYDFWLFRTGYIPPCFKPNKPKEQPLKNDDEHFIMFDPDESLKSAVDKLTAAPEGWELNHSEINKDKVYVARLSRNNLQGIVPRDAKPISSHHEGAIVISQDDKKADEVITGILKEWRAKRPSAYRVVRWVDNNVCVMIQATVPDIKKAIPESDPDTGNSVLFARGEVANSMASLAIWATKKAIDISPKMKKVE